MSISLDAKQKSIREIFFIQEQYSIPSYQRAYSWGYDECYMLYIDLIEAFDKKEDYFLGNIITARSSDIETQKKLDVIDGQQRLTSLLLILKVLNLLYPSHKGPYKCIWLESLESDDKFPRIESNIFESKYEQFELKDIFKISENKLKEDLPKVVREEEIDTKKLEYFSKNKFYKNTLMFYYWFLYYFENNKNEQNSLANFVNYLLEKVSLLPIELYGKDKDEATEKALKIFETINNRGLNLSDADIFKSKLYILADDKDFFISRWNELKEKTNSLKISINDVFRFYSHIIRGKEKIISAEINLREFFTIKEYSPLKLKNSNEIMDDLFKIVDILIQLNYLKQEKEPISKWLQVLDLYTNQFPKFALVVYLFNRGFDSEFKVFIQKLIKMVYSRGSTTYIKWEIYSLIYDITYNREININISVIDDIDINRGRLKKGFILLGYCLSNINLIYPYKIDKILTIKDKDKLRNSWSNIVQEQIDIKLEEIGNFLVFQDKYELESKKEVFLGSYKKFEEYNQDIKKKIINFFEITND